MKRPKVGQYHYALRGRFFRIYRYTSVTDSGTTATPVMEEPLLSDREQARRRVYQLNGWNYTPRQ